MKRSIILAVPVAMLVFLALILSCSKSPPTAVDLHPSAIAAKPIYDHDGVRVYRVLEHPELLAVRYQMFLPGDPQDRSTRLMTYREAAGQLKDDTRVTAIAVWLKIPAGKFEPSTGVRSEVPRVRPAAQPFGGGEPPGGCACQCCTYEAGVCYCSWGCLKTCYRNSYDET